MPRPRQFTIAPGVVYQINPMHRGNTHGRSRWIISEDEESNCFSLAFNEDWLVEDNGWGLHLVNGTPDYLGLIRPGRSVFVAKFVDGHGRQEWHGYPADHQRNSSDIPPHEVAQDWMENNFLSPSKIRKLLRGQPCSL